WSKIAAVARIRRTYRRISGHVGSEESKVPQTDEGPHARRVAAWQHRRVRGLRSPGDDARVDLEPIHRSGPYRHDAPHQAWRKGLDPDLPGQADHEKAARSPDGEG